MSSKMNSVARKEWTPRWGRWTLDAAGDYPTLEIQPYTHSTTKYEVRLFEPGCTHEEYTAWLGRWVSHLHGKSWAAYKDVYMFVEAAKDIRGWECADANKPEWEDISKGPLVDGIYSKMRHRCGTVMNVAQGSVLVCPECNPEEWAKERGRVIHG